MPALFNRFFGTKGRREMVLYVHFPCFDGVVSAVLAKATLEMGSKAVVRKIVPVTYDVRDRWLNTRLEKHAVVVDFLFHPDAEYWADHHKTTFLSESAARSFRFHFGRKKWLYEPQLLLARRSFGILAAQFCMNLGAFKSLSRGQIRLILRTIFQFKRRSSVMNQLSELIGVCS